MTTPISPDVVNATVNVDHHIAKINAFLSTPWSTYDRMTGRWYSTREMGTVEREAVEAAFKAAGWGVRWSDDQREGSALVFMPRSVR